MRRKAWLLASWLTAVGCTDVTTNLATDLVSKDSGTRTASAMDSGVAPPIDAATAEAAAPLGPGHPAQCGDHTCACDDGKDNDGDGLVDGLDPECTGPFDDDESSFATGAPAGMNRCKDCFWDNNSGSGDDDCRYPQECLQNAAFSGKGACSSCAVSQLCVDNCQKRTPNGCDCFGCCEITRPDGGTLLIALSDGCSLKNIDDAKACPRCVQSSACINPCGRCELCPGRRVEDLPADCGAGAKDAGTRYVCDEGQPSCSDTKSCAVGSYCQLGCCLYAVQ